MAAMGGRDDHAVGLRPPPRTRRARVVLASAPPTGRVGPSPDPTPAPEMSPDGTASVASGRRTVFATIALAGLCVLVVDTAVGILPDDALAGNLPLLSVLTVQRLVVIACLLCLVIAAPRPSTFVTPVDLPLLALVAVAAVALLQDGQSMAAWRGLVTAVAIFYVAVGVLRRHPDAAPVLLVTVLGAAFVAAAIGVQQAADGVDTGFYRVGLENSAADADGAVTRSTGTFSNPNLLAGYLVLALPLTVGLLGRRLGDRLRVAWVVLAGIVAAGLVVTFSRGAVAALVVVAVTGVVVLAAARRGRAVALLVLAVSAVGLALAVAAASLTGVLGRVSGREDLWEAAVEAAGTGGLSGVGYGRAGDVMTAVSGETYAHAHNLWLNWLVETGPLGPVLISLVLIVGFVAGVRRALGGSALAAGAVAALGAVTLASVVDHPTVVSSILTLALVAVACTVAGPLPCVDVRGRHVRDSSSAAAVPPAAMQREEDRPPAAAAWTEPPPDPGPSYPPVPTGPPVRAAAPEAAPPLNGSAPHRVAAPGNGAVPPAPASVLPGDVPDGYPPVPRPVSVPRSLTFDSDHRTPDGPQRPESHGGHGLPDGPDPGVIVPADVTAPVPVSRRPRRALRPDGD